MSEPAESDLNEQLSNSKTVKACNSKHVKLSVSVFAHSDACLNASTGPLILDWSGSDLCQIGTMFFSFRAPQGHPDELR
jgi:hypothetical protein